MQRNKVSILSTRSLEEQHIRDASAKGVFIDVISFIETQPIQSIETQQEIENALKLTAAVVFTSATAVEAVAAELEGQHPDWQIFCVGYATRQAVEKYLAKNLIAGTAASAKDLANVIISEADSDEVIFFCGDQRRDELPNILRSADIAVNEIIVYQTVALPKKLEKKYDGILFFSPSAVKSFFQKNRLTGGTVLFAIGDTTANELRRFSTNKIVISSQPDKERLLKEIILYFQENPIHH